MRGAPRDHFSAPPVERRLGKPGVALDTARRFGRYESEGWRQHRDGRRFWALVALDAIRDENGDLIGFATVTHDMTERRAAEEALWESERRFRLLVNGVVDYALVMLDRDGYVARRGRPDREHGDCGDA